MTKAKSLMTLSLLMLAALAAPLHAETVEDPCTGFAWSVDKEIEWFKQEGTPEVAHDGTVAALPSGAIMLKLIATKDIAFQVKPALKQQALGPASFSGWVKIEGQIAPGLYQISLSENAWIDVIQGGEALQSTAFTGKHECTSLRKSVRFEIKGAPFIIQIAGARSGTMKLAIRKAE